MSECRDLEPLLAPYVDGEAEPKDCATVDAHLRACPPCRDRVAGERAARDVLHARREGLRACASPQLRRRCTAHFRHAASGSAGVLHYQASTRRSWMPLSLAATLVLAVAGVFVLGLYNGVEALAMQLALDHIKCFKFAPEHTSADAAGVAREWSAAQGWALKVPSSASTEHLELLGVRRCLSTAGLTAHVMYRWRGEPLSLYILNSPPRGAPDVEHVVQKFGEEAIIWSHGSRTYAVVGKVRPPELQQLAKYVRHNAE